MLTKTPLFLEYNGRGDFMVSDPRLFAAQRRLCEHAALHAAARVVVVSEVERRRLTREGIDPQRILVCPNGVDARRFDTGGGERVRQALGVKASDQLIGFVGTFGPWHGAPVLAEAFVRLAAEAPAARLLLVGDGLERPVVETILAAHRAEDRVILVGKVPSGEVPSYLDACDILASPHVPLPAGEEFFGSPTKLFEYMAAAKPIVASRLGQIGDVLVDGETALLVPPGSVEELERGILLLLGDAQLRERLGRAAREAAIAHHSWDRNVAEIARAYGELMPTGAKR
jgi:glycosyltransferase involved in cell wall biosynthesis